MGGRVLGVLLWKHWCVRKRRIIFTTLEYFIPLVLFILIYVAKYKIFGNLPIASGQEKNRDIQRPEAVRLNEFHRSDCVLFTPNTKFTNLLMDSVGKKLGLKRHDEPAGAYCGYSPFNDTSEIANYTMSERDAVVIFQMSGEESDWNENIQNSKPLEKLNYEDNGVAVPKDLKYTIRTKDNYNTRLDTSEDGQLIPHGQFGRVYEKFMRLQWAIDSSYLEMRSGEPVKQEVIVQEFPFANSEHSMHAAIIVTILGLVCFFSLVLVFTLLVARLIGERANGMQELMKMSGVSSWMLGAAHLADTLPGMLSFSVGGAVFLTVGSPPLLDHTNGLLLFIFLFLHSFTIVAFGFVCGYLLRSLEYTSTLATSIFIGLSLACQCIMQYVGARALLLFALVPGLPLRWLMREMELLYVYGTGITFGSLGTSHDPQIPAPAIALLCMVLQTSVFLLVAWYLDHVCPGKLGLALPWDFLFKKQYWRKNNVVPDSLEDDGSELNEEEQGIDDTREEQYFEPAPDHAEVGIKVVNVTKVFPNHRALNNVSLDVYKGELTILLGHNGAGKTTLLSIMTGTMNPTAGRVYINGQDIMKTSETRRQIGFCPQQDMFYPQMSVEEHAILFSMLRGQSRAEALKSSKLLLERLGIEGKASALSGALSGGMRRRLQMACALAGDAALVVLDEPSSGLDVETRRGLWDLLLTLRDNRTLVISTHFMEEADALGDRVAALHRGVLRCHASPMHLKKAIGTGYRLTFTTTGPPKQAAITDAVRSAVPDATVKEVTMNSISFGLPAAQSGSFAGMFAALERRRAELGVDSIGVGVSTLEEVFLQLCSDIDRTQRTDDEVDGVSAVEPTYATRTGVRLYSRQFYELMKRQLLYIWHKKYSFLIWQVVIPITIVAAMGMQQNNSRAPGAAGGPAARALDVGAYDPAGAYRVLYRADPAHEGDVRAVGERYPAVTFERADDVAEDVLRIGIEDVMEYHKYLAGIEINETNAKVLFTTTVRHAAPAALSLLANVLGRRAGAALAVRNEPFERDRPVAAAPGYEPAKEAYFVWMFAIFVGSVLLFNLVNAAHLAITERASGARHLHVMAGCPPELHWASTLIFRTAVTILTFIVPVLIVCACDPDKTFSDPNFIGAWFAVLTLGTTAFLAFLFLFTFVFNELGVNTLLSTCIFINIVSALVSLGAPQGSAVGAACAGLQHVLPGHAALRGLLDAGLRARHAAECRLNRGLCPTPLLPAHCCGSEEGMCMFCYGTDEQPAPGYSMVILIFQFIIYMSLVFMTQRGLVSSLVERLKASAYTPPQTSHNDEMVRAERAYVSKAIDLPTPQISDVMLVSELHKVHWSLCKRLTALKGVSFSVKRGECLGLLGVNGAGKSTAFRVLTAEDWPTRGRVFAGGHRREGYSTQYMRGLGYCPQFFGLDEFLTGRQNLRLMLTLRGLSERDAADETASWIHIVGLQKYIDRLVVGYSGGCRRRLAAACALGSGARLALLDEPTAGVDVAARRRVWAALRRGLAAQRAVVISSHSMDEMEALCGRIGILSAGSLRALGAPAELRAAHARGHALTLKLRPARDDRPARGPSSDETDSTVTPLRRLKGTLEERFDCTLKDEHKTMLHYHINQTMEYSKLFEEMERLKSLFPEYVEDYAVTETTLEEVFLSFARGGEQPTDSEEGQRPRSRGKTPESRAMPV